MNLAMAKKDLLWQGLGLLLAVSPGILLAVLILKYAVNIIYWDQWDVALTIHQYFINFNISFQALISQHNESRLLFPRLIFIGLAYLTHWDVRYEMLVTFLLACLISFNVYRLNRLTLGGGRLQAIAIFFLANLLIFAPIQYENWLWGIQIVVFAPTACITSAIVIGYSKLNVRVKFLIGIILSTISTFSYANGILCWVIIFPALVLVTWKDLVKEKWLLLAWLTGFFSNLFLYFYDYHKPEGSPSILLVILQPERLVKFFFGFLGSPLVWGLIKIDWSLSSLLTKSFVMGLVLVSIFVGTFIYLINHRKDSGLITRMIGWLMIGAYPIVSSLIAGVGRSGDSPEAGLALRYTTFSVALPIALLHLVAITFNDANAKGYLANNQKRIVRFFSLILLGIFIYLHIITSEFAITRMNLWSLDILQGKACVAFINVVTETKCIKEKVYPNDTFKVKEMANKLSEIGFISVKLINNSNIGEIVGNLKLTEKDYKYGWFDSFTKEIDREFIAAGWAILPDKKTPSDAVVLTYENTQGEDIIFAISDQRIERQDVAKIMNHSEYFMSGWRKLISANRLPKGLLRIKAWAFDTNTGKAYKIGGTQVLKNL